MALEVKKGSMYFEGEKFIPSGGLGFDPNDNYALCYNLKEGHKKVIFSQYLPDEIVKKLVGFMNKNDLTCVRLLNRVEKGKWDFSLNIKNYFNIINETNEKRLNNGKQPIITIVPFACRWLTKKENIPHYINQANKILNDIKEATNDKEYCPIIIEIGNEAHDENLKAPKEVLDSLEEIVPDKYPTMFVAHAVVPESKKVNCDIKGLNLYSFPRTLGWKELASFTFKESGINEKASNGILLFLTEHVFPFIGSVLSKTGKMYNTLSYDSMLSRFLGIKLERDSILDSLADKLVGMLIDDNEVKSPVILTEFGCFFMERPRPNLEQVMGFMEQAEKTINIMRKAKVDINWTYQSIEEIIDYKTGKIWNQPLVALLKDFSEKTQKKEFGKWKNTFEYLTKQLFNVASIHGYEI